MNLALLKNGRRNQNRHFLFWVGLLGPFEGWLHPKQNPGAASENLGRKTILSAICRYGRHDTLWRREAMLFTYLPTTATEQQRNSLSLQHAPQLQSISKQVLKTNSQNKTGRFSKQVEGLNR